MKKLQILGAGCPKCHKLAQNTEAAAQSMGMEFEIVKVTNINDIIEFGVVNTPALAVDGLVKISGAVPSVEEIKRLLA